MGVASLGMTTPNPHRNLSYGAQDAIIAPIDQHHPNDVTKSEADDDHLSSWALISAPLYSSAVVNGDVARHELLAHNSAPEFVPETTMVRSSSPYPPTGRDIPEEASVPSVPTETYGLVLHTIDGAGDPGKHRRGKSGSRGPGANSHESNTKSPLGIGLGITTDLDLPSPSERRSSQTILVLKEDAWRTFGSVGVRAPAMGTTSQSPIALYKEHLTQDVEGLGELTFRSPYLAINPQSQFQPRSASVDSPKARVPSIREEEDSPTTWSLQAAEVSSGQSTGSTESNKTIRGGMTPRLTPSLLSGLQNTTPSYPFPRMKVPVSTPSAATTGRDNAPGVQRAASHPLDYMLQDQLRSDPSTPASAMVFAPPGSSSQSAGPFDFPTPNLYNLTLMLTAEPGIDAWWSCVVQIMREYYKAERVTLSIPADSTDLENVPWGQKATFNSAEADTLSVAYLGRGTSSVRLSTADGLSELSSTCEGSLLGENHVRPPILSRHSFTAYEKGKTSAAVQSAEAPNAALPRPSLNPRSQSNYPRTDTRLRSQSCLPLNKEVLERHDALEQHNPTEELLPGPTITDWERTLPAQTEAAEAKARVLPVLQALDLEADPLIDHEGVKRVIERGKVIALTRSYPYLESAPGRNEGRVDSYAEKLQAKKTCPTGESRSKAGKAAGGSRLARAGGRSKKSASLDRSKIASILSGIDDGDPRPATLNYEEYEQAPPSPWSQSPAPSPAIRADPHDNPFFTDAKVDEGSFNPSNSPQDYSNAAVPETIGIDHSWTVLHVPLRHILLSKSASAFKLNPAVLEHKSMYRGKADMRAQVDEALDRPTTSDSQRQKPQSPIAIISVLSPVIPYPSNLRHSLEDLAPHLATSFSLCRHYSNMETEVAALHRKRQRGAVGFGAIGPELGGHPVVDKAMLSSTGDARGAHPSHPSRPSTLGSMTSPSDTSHGTSASPNGAASSDCGKAAEHRPLLSPGCRPAVSPGHRPVASPGHSGIDEYFSAKGKGVPGHADSGPISPGQRSISLNETAAAERHRRSCNRQAAPGGHGHKIEADASEAVEPVHRNDDQGVQMEAEDSLWRSSGGGLGCMSNHRHTMLHSNGGDFTATFQSLPSGTHLRTRPMVQTSTPSRSGSSSAEQVTLLPPTERLKTLMLDTLPAHVFVALPRTGEVVWVNSRYLTYRGQTIEDLVRDPWGSIHLDDRGHYVDKWAKSLRTGQQFEDTVRIRRFDGAYRWHQARAVAARDKRGIVVQFIGSYMDIHDQKVLELAAAMKEEIEASEAKHRLLANLIPQIIFSATEDEGITFANQQWLSYTGQSLQDSLGFGFMDHVHPEDLAKCRIPSEAGSASNSDTPTPSPTSAATRMQEKGVAESASLHAPHDPGRNNGQAADGPKAELHQLARSGVVKVAKDGTGRLSYTTELRLRSKTGEYRWHLIRCVEVEGINFGNGDSSWFGSATDINDHKLLEAKLKEAMESKSRFLSNMSHEIRTPLIGISGMVSFLQDTVLNEEQRDYSNTIQTSANSLLMIINDILDLSKVDAGMMKLNFEWFHTRSLIEDVNELVSTMAIAKRLELNYVVEQDVPEWVKGDKVRIRQVLLNVVGNAIKFTSTGEVFSRCRVVDRLGKNEIMLELSITDTGRGFTKQEAELIFRPFSQIDGSSTRQHGGSGLGLVISRQLVELHGGKMNGTAIPGQGSTFTFTARFGLPTEQDHPQKITTPPSPSAVVSDQASSESSLITVVSAEAEAPVSSSPMSGTGATSPVVSSASSNPSADSVLSHSTTASTSTSSVNVGLVHGSETVKAGSPDLAQMKLELPSLKTWGAMPTPVDVEPATAAPNRPPMYSILIICPQVHSREATVKHIEMTLPKDVLYQITPFASVDEAQKLLGGSEAATFTHVVLNLGSATEIIEFIEQIMVSSAGQTAALILSDSVQRQSILKLCADTKHQKLLTEHKVTFINKPVKPSRFAAVFDPLNSRDVSIDRNRYSAAQMVENQKQSYLDVEKRIGNKGYRVLLVEDNPVNQKVLVKYLRKVGVESEIAADGVECTDAVLSRPPGYYSLILCDLHMPRKDGYTACREIRQWESKNGYGRMPVIALSANVMSDVSGKCAEAGFSDYVTKPVDFISLSTVMSKFF